MSQVAPRTSNPESDPRVYFAAERTLLAWLRTGLGLMGVGFAVARFGLFLRQMQAEQTHVATRAMGLSGWSGVALVALGVIVNLSAIVSHVRLVRQLRTGAWEPGRISTAGVALAVVLAAIGVAMAVYLVLVH